MKTELEFKPRYEATINLCRIKCENLFNSYLDYSGEVCSIEVVVCLQKYFTQPALTNRIVFGIELVEAMECVTILQNTAIILSHCNI